LAGRGAAARLGVQGEDSWWLAFVGAAAVVDLAVWAACSAAARGVARTSPAGLLRTG
jgi:hypothetical protein